MAKDVLFEIGLEELPARFINDAEQQLKMKTEKWLQDSRISYTSVVSYSTPRRLAVLIHEIAPAQTTIEEEAKGPALRIAQDEQGSWTKAAIGFTRGQGKTPEDIYTKDIKGTSYIFVKKHIEGKPTTELLPEFDEIIKSIQFSNNMRWGAETMRYARPIRWLVALYENRVIPFEIAHVKTGRTTYGHRFLGGEITLELPGEYEAKLKENFVIADSEMRRQLILDEMEKLAGEKSFHIPADSGLLNEVTNLVEFPTVFAGTYDSAFLDLPAEVLVTSMKEHQRYFPVQSEAGNLLSYFIGVRNGDSYKLDTVIKGNEKVLHARLSDARFFYEEDRKQSIAFFQEKLERVVFQEKLGTIHDKVNRVIRITKEIGRLLNVNEVTLSKAERAAEICKFDLPTNMVNEFTELQGIMGERYALYFGEDETVAAAIREHYMPVNANGELPVTEAGSIVSAADKLDTIVGCISAGLIPTGSHDPYGLRRQATGILRIMDRKGWHIRLEDLIAITQAVYQPLDLTADSGKTADDLHQFFQLRAAYLLKEEGIEQDVIQAVLKEEIGLYSYSLAKAAVLSEMRSDPGFKNVQEALVRVLNLAKKAEQTEVNQDLLATDSEKTLYQQFVITSENAKLANDKQEARQALQQLGELTEPINNFFEHNMVMAEDAALRKNRLALVNNIAALLYDFADLSEIQWKQHS